MLRSSWLNNDSLGNFDSSQRQVYGFLFGIETTLGLMAVIVYYLVPSGTIETILLFPGAIAEYVVIQVASA
jgi:hypothetical protein